MYAEVEKPKEIKNRVIANSVVQKRSNNNVRVGVEGKRPKASGGGNILASDNRCLPKIQPEKQNAIQKKTLKVDQISPVSMSTGSVITLGSDVVSEGHILQRVDFISSKMKRKITISDQKLETHSARYQCVPNSNLYWLVHCVGVTAAPINLGGKTLFPYDWDTEKITNSIKHVFENNPKWIPSSTGDLDATGKYEGIEITIRKKPNSNYHITSAWPTVNNTIKDPDVEATLFNNCLTNMQSWIDYYNNNRDIGDMKAQKDVGTNTINALKMYKGTSMAYYVKPTLEAAENLFREIEKEEMKAKIETIAGEIKTTAISNLNALKNKLSDLMNSENMERVNELIDTINEAIEGEEKRKKELIEKMRDHRKDDKNNEDDEEEAKNTREKITKKIVI